MGILRISNEQSLTQPRIVKQCIDYLKREHCAVIHSKTPERDCIRYEITGDGIPDGQFDLRLTYITADIFTIKINAI